MGGGAAAGAAVALRFTVDVLPAVPRSGATAPCVRARSAIASSRAAPWSRMASAPPHRPSEHDGSDAAESDLDGWQGIAQLRIGGMVGAQPDAHGHSLGPQRRADVDLCVSQELEFGALEQRREDERPLHERE